MANKNDVNFVVSAGIQISGKEIEEQYKDQIAQVISDMENGKQSNLKVHLNIDSKSPIDKKDLDAFEEKATKMLSESIENIRNKFDKNQIQKLVDDIKEEFKQAFGNFQQELPNIINAKMPKFNASDVVEPIKKEFEDIMDELNEAQKEAVKKVNDAKKQQSELTKQINNLKIELNKLNTQPKRPSIKLGTTVYTDRYYNSFKTEEEKSKEINKIIQATINNYSDLDKYKSFYDKKGKLLKKDGSNDTAIDYLKNLGYISIEDLNDAIEDTILDQEGERTSFNNYSRLLINWFEGNKEELNKYINKNKNSFKTMGKDISQMINSIFASDTITITDNGKNLLTWSKDIANSKQLLEGKIKRLKEQHDSYSGVYGDNDYRSAKEVLNKINEEYNEWEKLNKKDQRSVNVKFSGLDKLDEKVQEQIKQVEDNIKPIEIPVSIKEDGENSIKSIINEVQQAFDAVVIDTENITAQVIDATNKALDKLPDAVFSRSVKAEQDETTALNELAKSGQKAAEGKQEVTLSNINLRASIDDSVPKIAKETQEFQKLGNSTERVEGQIVKTSENISEHTEKVANEIDNIVQQEKEVADTTATTVKDVKKELELVKNEISESNNEFENLKDNTVNVGNEVENVNNQFNELLKTIKEVTKKDFNLFGKSNKENALVLIDALQYLSDYRQKIKRTPEYNYLFQNKEITAGEVQNNKNNFIKLLQDTQGNKDSEAAKILWGYVEQRLIDLSISRNIQLTKNKSLANDIQNPEVTEERIERKRAAIKKAVDDETRLLDELNNIILDSGFADTALITERRKELNNNLQNLLTEKAELEKNKADVKDISLQINNAQLILDQFNELYNDNNKKVPFNIETGLAIRKDAADKIQKNRISRKSEYDDLLKQFVVAKNNITDENEKEIIEAFEKILSSSSFFNQFTYKLFDRLTTRFVLSKPEMESGKQKISKDRAIRLAQSGLNEDESTYGFGYDYLLQRRKLSEEFLSAAKRQLRDENANISAYEKLLTVYYGRIDVASQTGGKSDEKIILDQVKTDLNHEITQLTTEIELKRNKWIQETQNMSPEELNKYKRTPEGKKIQDKLTEERQKRDVARHAVNLINAINSKRIDEQTGTKISFDVYALQKIEQLTKRRDYHQEQYDEIRNFNTKHKIEQALLNNNNSFIDKSNLFVPDNEWFETWALQEYDIPSNYGDAIRKLQQLQLYRSVIMNMKEHSDKGEKLFNLNDLQNQLNDLKTTYGVAPTSPDVKNQQLLLEQQIDELSNEVKFIADSEKQKYIDDYKNNGTKFKRELTNVDRRIKFISEHLRYAELSAQETRNAFDVLSISQDDQEIDKNLKKLVILNNRSENLVTRRSSIALKRLPGVKQKLFSKDIDKRNITDFISSLFSDQITYTDAINKIVEEINNIKNRKTNGIIFDKESNLYKSADITLDDRLLQLNQNKEIIKNQVTQDIQNDIKNSNSTIKILSKKLEDIKNKADKEYGDDLPRWVEDQIESIENRIDYFTKLQTQDVDIDTLIGYGVQRFDKPINGVRYNYQRIKEEEAYINSQKDFDVEYIKQLESIRDDLIEQQTQKKKEYAELNSLATGKISSKLDDDTQKRINEIDQDIVNAKLQLKNIEDKYNKDISELRGKQLIINEQRNKTENELLKLEQDDLESKSNIQERLKINKIPGQLKSNIEAINEMNKSFVPQFDKEFEEYELSISSSKANLSKSSWFNGSEYNIENIIENILLDGRKGTKASTEYRKARKFLTEKYDWDTLIKLFDISEKLKSNLIRMNRPYNQNPEIQEKLKKEQEELLQQANNIRTGSIQIKKNEKGLLYVDQNSALKTTSSIEELLEQKDKFLTFLQQLDRYMTVLVPTYKNYKINRNNAISKNNIIKEDINKIKEELANQILTIVTDEQSIISDDEIDELQKIVFKYGLEKINPRLSKELMMSNFIKEIGESKNQANILELKQALTNLINSSNNIATQIEFAENAINAAKENVSSLENSKQNLLRQNKKAIENSKQIRKDAKEQLKNNEYNDIIPSLSKNSILNVDETIKNFNPLTANLESLWTNYNNHNISNNIRTLIERELRGRFGFNSIIDKDKNILFTKNNLNENQLSQYILEHADEMFDKDFYETYENILVEYQNKIFTESEQTIVRNAQYYLKRVKTGNFGLSFSNIPVPELTPQVEKEIKKGLYVNLKSDKTKTLVDVEKILNPVVQSMETKLLEIIIPELGFPIEKIIEEYATKYKYELTKIAPTDNMVDLEQWKKAYALNQNIQKELFTRYPEKENRLIYSDQYAKNIAQISLLYGTKYLVGNEIKGFKPQQKLIESVRAVATEQENTSVVAKNTTAEKENTDAKNENVVASKEKTITGNSETSTVKNNTEEVKTNTDALKENSKAKDENKEKGIQLRQSIIDEYNALEKTSNGRLKKTNENFQHLNNLISKTKEYSTLLGADPNWSKIIGVKINKTISDTLTKLYLSVEKEIKTEQPVQQPVKTEPVGSKPIKEEPKKEIPQVNIEERISEIVKKILNKEFIEVNQVVTKLVDKQYKSRDARLSAQQSILRRGYGIAPGEERNLRNFNLDIAVRQLSEIKQNATSIQNWVTKGYVDQFKTEIDKLNELIHTIETAKDTKTKDAARRELIMRGYGIKDGANRQLKNFNFGYAKSQITAIPQYPIQINDKLNNVLELQNNAINVKPIQLLLTLSKKVAEQQAANKNGFLSGTTAPLIEEAPKVEEAGNDIVSEIDKVIDKCRELQSQNKPIRTMLVTSGLRNIKSVLSEQDLDLDNLSDEQLIKLATGFNKLKNAVDNEASQMAQSVKKYVENLLQKFNIQILDLAGLNWNDAFPANKFIGEAITGNNPGVIATETGRPFITKGNNLIQRGNVFLNDGGKLSRDIQNTVYDQYIDAIEQLQGKGFTPEIIAELLFGNSTNSQIVDALKNKLPLDESLKTYFESIIKDGYMLSMVNIDLAKDWEIYQSNKIDISSKASNSIQDFAIEYANLLNENKKYADLVNSGQKEFSSQLSNALAATYEFEDKLLNLGLTIAHNSITKNPGILPTDDFLNDDSAKMVELIMNQDGKWAVEGFNNGINSEINNVESTVKQIPDITKSVVEEGLKINSPSKVMEELGFWTVEGFTKGIITDINGVQLSGEQIKKALIEGFNKDNSSLDDLVKTYFYHQDKTHTNYGSLGSEVAKQYREILKERGYTGSFNWKEHQKYSQSEIGYELPWLKEINEYEQFMNQEKDKKKKYLDDNLQKILDEIGAEEQFKNLFKGKNIIKQTSPENKYFINEEENLIEGYASVVEKLIGGQTRNLLAKFAYDPENTGDLLGWNIVSKGDISTVFSSIENQILSLDKQINNKRKIDAKNKLAYGNLYNSEAINDEIQKLSNKRNDLFKILQIYSQEDSGYAYNTIKEFELREKDFIDSLNRELSSSKEKNNADVKLKSNKRLATLLERTKDQKARAEKPQYGLSQESLTEISDEFNRISTEIDRKKNTLISPEEFEQVESMVNAYKRLIQTKIDLNNISKKQLSGEKTTVRIKELISSIDKLIGRNDQLGITDQNISQIIGNLNTQKSTLESLLSKKGKGEISDLDLVKQYYSQQELFKSNKSDLEGLVAGSKNAQAKNKILKKAEDQYTQLIKQWNSKKDAIRNKEADIALAKSSNKPTGKLYDELNKLKTEADQYAIDVKKQFEDLHKLYASLNDKDIDKQKKHDLLNQLNSAAINYTGNTGKQEDINFKIQQNQIDQIINKYKELLAIKQKIVQFDKSKYADESIAEDELRVLKDKESQYNQEYEKLQKQYSSKYNTANGVNINDITEDYVHNSILNLDDSVTNIQKKLISFGASEEEASGKTQLLRNAIIELRNSFVQTQDLEEFNKTLQTITTGIRISENIINELGKNAQQTTFNGILKKLSSLNKVSNKDGMSELYQSKINQFYADLSSAREMLLSEEYSADDVKNALTILSDSIALFEKNKKSLLIKNSNGLLSPINSGQINDMTDLQTSMQQYIDKVGGTNSKLLNYNEDLQSISMQYNAQDKSIVTLTGHLDEYTHSMRLTTEAQTKSRRTAQQIGNVLKETYGRMAYYFSFYSVLRKTIGLFREGINTLKQFDSTLTTISYTMNITKTELNDIGDSILNMAKNLSMSIENASSIYQIYANMQTTAKEIEETAKPTAILSNLSGVSADVAADQVQGVLQQFHLLENGANDVADVSMHVVDVLDNISANIAMDYAKGISVITEAVTATGQVAYDAGMSYEQLAAITAKVAERTREDGSTIGNALKTMFTRISKVSKMPSYADEIDNETVSKAAEALHAVGIEVYNSDGSFKNITETLSELSKKWDDLNDAQQSYISYQIAATRQSSKFKTMLEAFGEAEALAQEATLTDGNALANQEKWEESFAGKLQKLQTEWRAFWTNVVESSGFKTLIDVLIDIVKWLDRLGDSIGYLTPVLITLSASLFAFAKIKSIFSSKLLSGFKLFNKEAIKSAAELTNLINVIGLAEASELGLTGAITKLDIQKAIDILKTKEQLTSEEQLLLKKLESIAANKSEEVILRRLSVQKEKQVAINGKYIISLLKEHWLVAAIILVITALVTIITKANEAEEEHNRLLDESVDKLNDSVNSFKELSQSIDDHIETLERYSDVLKDNINKESMSQEVKEELYNAQEDIIDQFGSMSEGIDLINGKYEDQIELLKNIKKESIGNFLTEELGNYNNAIEKLQNPNIKIRSEATGFSSVNGEDFLEENVYNGINGFISGTNNEKNEIAKKKLKDLQTTLSQFNFVLSRNDGSLSSFIYKDADFNGNLDFKKTQDPAKEFKQFYQDILNFEDWYRNLSNISSFDAPILKGIHDSIQELLSSEEFNADQLKKAVDLTNQYEEIAAQYSGKQVKTLTGETKTIADLYANYINAYNEYLANPSSSSAKFNFDNAGLEAQLSEDIINQLDSVIIRAFNNVKNKKKITISNPNLFEDVYLKMVESAINVGKFPRETGKQSLISTLSDYAEQYGYNNEKDIEEFQKKWVFSGYNLQTFNKLLQETQEQITISRAKFLNQDSSLFKFGESKNLTYEEVLDSIIKQIEAAQGLIANTDMSSEELWKTALSTLFDKEDIAGIKIDDYDQFKGTATDKITAYIRDLSDWLLNFLQTSSSWSDLSTETQNIISDQINSATYSALAGGEDWKNYQADLDKINFLFPYLEMAKNKTALTDAEAQLLFDQYSLKTSKAGTDRNFLNTDDIVSKYNEIVNAANTAAIQIRRAEKVLQMQDLSEQLSIYAKSAPDSFDQARKIYSEQGEDALRSFVASFDHFVASSDYSTSFSHINVDKLIQLFEAEKVGEIVGDSIAEAMIDEFDNSVLKSNWESKSGTIQGLLERLIIGNDDVTKQEIIDTLPDFEEFYNTNESIFITDENLTESEKLFTMLFAYIRSGTLDTLAMMQDESYETFSYMLEEQNEFLKGSNKVDTLVDSYYDLSDVLDKVKNGYVFNQDEMKTLGAKYPELLKSINVVDDGYKLTEDTVKDLIQTYGEEANAAINSQLNVANATIDYCKAQINAFEDLTEAIDIVRNAYNNMGIASTLALAYGSGLITQEQTAKIYEAWVANGRTLEALQQAAYGTNLGFALEMFDSENYIDTYKNTFKDIAGNLEKLRDEEGTEIDWLTQKIQHFQDNLDDATAAYDNLITKVSSTNKATSTFYDDQIALLQKQKNALEDLRDTYVIAEQEYLSRYQNTISKYGINSTIQKAIEDGTQQKIVKYSPAQKKFAEGINKAIDYWNSMRDAQKQQVEYNAKIASVDTTALDNAMQGIAERFERALNRIDFDKSVLEKKLDITTSRGFMANSNYYKTLIVNETAAYEANQKQYEELMKQYEAYKDISDVTKEMGDKYEELKTKIQDVTISMYENISSLISYQNELRQLRWDVREREMNIYSSIVDESNFYIDELSRNADKLYTSTREMLYGDNFTTKLFDSSLTSEGEAVLGLHMANMKLYKKSANEYEKDIKEINEQIAQSGNEANVELLDKRNELIQSYRDSIKSMNDEKQAMIDLVREGYDKQIESLQTLIDKYMEAKNAEKDMYSYEEDMRKKTKDLTNLRKQMAAYVNDTSEEARMKVQQLQVQIEDAEKDIRDTEQDKYLDEQQKMLDNLYNQYEAFVDEKFENEEKILKQLYKEVKQNSSEITETLGSDNTGLPGISKTLSNIFNMTIGGGKTVGAAIDESENHLNAIKASVSEIPENIKSILKYYGINPEDLTDTTLTELISSLLSKVDSTVDLTFFDGDEWSTNKLLGEIRDDVRKLIPSSTPDGRIGLPQAPATASSSYKIGKDTYTVDQLKTMNVSDIAKKYSEKELNQFITANGLSGVGYQFDTESGKWFVRNTKEDIETKKYSTREEALAAYIKKYYKKNAYAVGNKKVKDEELAWTQEKGMEAIIRPTDNAILTPLKSGDSVLTANATKNIWDMANNPYKFIKDNLSASIDGANILLTAGSRNVNTNVAMSITLPSVQNYNEFVSSLQKDKKFQSMIQDMTVNQMMGGNSLAKNKYKF